MTNPIRDYRKAAVCLCLIFAGCRGNQGPKPEAMESPLPKLTSAVLAEVRYPETATPAPDDQLIPTVMKNKPELQAAFRGVPIKVWHDDRNVVLLVCSPDGNYCWLEDASWTPGVDRRCYANKPLPPAEFTLIPSPGPVGATRPSSQPTSTATRAGP